MKRVAEDSKLTYDLLVGYGVCVCVFACVCVCVRQLTLSFPELVVLLFLQVTLLWASLIQSTPPYPTFLSSTILPQMPGSSFDIFRPQTCIYFSYRYEFPVNILWRTPVMNLLIAFSVCPYTNTQGHMKPNIAFSKTGQERKSGVG